MDNRRLDLNLLLALDALLAEQNVTRAARRLNLSQPALSAQLTRLRMLLGDQLMIPTSRGVLPTAMALELQAPLRAILNQARDLVNRAQPFDPAIAKITLSVAASDYMQVAVLLPFLVKLNATAPGLRIAIRLLDPLAVASQLERGEIDVAFVQTATVEAPSLRSIDVLSDEYVGIARRGSIKRGKMAMSPFLAARHIIVSPTGKGFIGPTDIALAATGSSRNVAFAVASFVFLIEAVSRCELIALAPKRLTERYMNDIDTFEPPVRVPGFSIAMLWHDRTNDHPGRQWLRREIKAFCALL
ncbi:LysR family transcriptional regulator (plasmid) [Lichenicola cladoniae]|uniref:LysR family transcriptional regulator n=2 Tax=Lichenicola cladoniae TaxID=1484109 RepID=A0A6M8HYV7_9PROT|nr:LysR family transcriptional regulator [Acetobacteraceae bacterium]QKE93582.1 LysR family transcriptional regulator [Lichenicola cladoniae]